MASVIRDNKLQQLDTFLFYKCHLISNHPIKNMSVWVSKSGDGYLYFAIALLVFLSEATQASTFFYSTLLAFAFELPIYVVLKNAVKRNRPFNKLSEFQSHIAPSDKFSMPSGHTAAAFVFATTVAHFFPEFTILVYCWASLIGLSRVLLGVHFPGDIVAGGLLGVLCANIGLSILATGF